MKPEIEVFDERFRDVVVGPVERLCTGAIWGEGPLWLPEDGSVIWSDIHSNRILRWSPTDGMSTWLEDVEYTNGRYRDSDGAIVYCSHGRRAIMRSYLDDKFRPSREEIVVDCYQGRKLNSPNDVVVKSDGTIWFSDPPYGILKPEEGHPAPSEQKANHVFRFDPNSGSLRAVSDYVEDPNGLAFSMDERHLYVSDTSIARKTDGYHRIVVFDVIGGEDLANPRLFAEISPGVPDGFRLDANGWIYTSCADGVQVYSEEGILLGYIHVPETVSNVTFGGTGRNELFITASSSLYRVRTSTTGLQPY